MKIFGGLPLLKIGLEKKHIHFVADSFSTDKMRMFAKNLSSKGQDLTKLWTFPFQQDFSQHSEKNFKVPQPPQFWSSDCLFRLRSIIIYMYRSHAKGHSQNFKIEEVEELWNSCQNSEKNLVQMEKFITWSNLDLLNSIFLLTSSFY